MNESKGQREFKSPTVSVLLKQGKGAYPEVVGLVNDYARLVNMTPTCAASAILREVLPKRIAKLQKIVKTKTV